MIHYSFSDKYKTNPLHVLWQVQGEAGAMVEVWGPAMIPDFFFIFILKNTKKIGRVRVCPVMLQSRVQSDEITVPSKIMGFYWDMDFQYLWVDFSIFSKVINSAEDDEL